MIKKGKIAAWLIKIIFVVSLFFSSDVVWHTESQLPEAAQIELVVTNSKHNENVVSLAFNKDTPNTFIKFCVPVCILFRVQDHNRILHLTFNEQSKKRSFFNAVVFIPALIYHTDNLNSHSLKA